MEELQSRSGAGIDRGNYLGARQVELQIPVFDPGYPCPIAQLAAEHSGYSIVRREAVLLVVSKGYQLGGER